MVWLQFLVAAGLIVASGIALVIYADRLADKTGASRALIGLILLSVVTSLPELGTSFSAVAYVGKPNLAAGNIFGSNTFNILVLVIIDFMLGSASIYALSRVSHTRSVLLAMLMTIVAIVSMQFSTIGFFDGRIGPETVLLLAIYVVGIFFIFDEEKQTPHPEPSGLKESVAVEIAVVVGSGIVVVSSGYWLAYISDDIAIITGWGESFVGYFFLAITTSLPELVVAITAIRLKAYDMAIANVIGSCFFNILMFSIVDPFYHAPVLQNIGPSNLTLALVSLTMVGVAGAALYAGTRGFRLGFVKWLLIALYLFGSYVVFSPV